MGNTEFFRETQNIQKNFKWSEIFSEVTKSHEQTHRDKLLVSGCTAYMPSTATMLKEWTKPWLFARFGLIGLAFCVLLYFITNVTSAASTYAMLVVAPAFIVPVSVMLFFWEMNIPRDISILDLLKYMLFAGSVSGGLTFVVRDILLITSDMPAWVSGPIPEEIAKFLMVYLIIKKKDCKYILNGLLVGAAVGAGFAATESAGYAINCLLTGGYESMIDVSILRGIWAICGHEVWASLYGAALVSAKKDKPLKAAHLVDKLVILMFAAAVLLHVAWNYDIVNLLARFADLPIAYSLLNFLEVYKGKNILLTIITWMINFKLIRMGMIQVIDISQKAQPVINPIRAAVVQTPIAMGISVVGKSGVLQGRTFYQNSEGTLLFGRDSSQSVIFPDGTKGISSRHCEIKVKDGIPVLIDRGSTYGTFLENGKKLEKNVPVRIQNGMKFYLATKENCFEIKM